MQVVQTTSLRILNRAHFCVWCPAVDQFGGRMAVRFSSTGFVSGTLLEVVTCLILCSSHVTSDSFPTATTIYGKVKGTFVSTWSGTKASVFLGIPYAAAPVKERRFAEAVPPEKWDGVRDCTRHPPRCLQMNEKVDLFVPPPAGDSENCLTLNVFTSNVDTWQNHAVMVFIHGGSFVIGSAFEYGIEGVVENLVSKEVVVVIIQYRLGLFGFASTGTPVAAGNWGLWDQIEALKWVRGNIGNFGGDPRRVTVFGESAGSASISLLTYIPTAHEYFHQAIQQSGSKYTLGVLNDVSVRATPYLAEAVGCPKSPDHSMIECLRGVSADDLLAAHRKLFEYGYKEGNAPPFRFNPTVDGHLIPSSVTNLSSILQAKPAIIGTNNLEMAFLLTPPPQMKLYRKHSPGVVSREFSMADFDRTVSAFFPDLLYPNSANILKRLCRFHYLDSQGDFRNQTFIIRQYLEILGDLWFHAVASREASEKTEIGSRIWMYSFDYYNKNMFPSDYIWKGALHSFDLLFLFNVDFQVFKFERTEQDKQLDAVWAVYRDPNTGGDAGSWPTFTSYDDSPTLHIGSSTELRRSFHQSSSVFWNKLVAEVEALAKRHTSKTDTSSSYATDREEL